MAFQFGTKKPMQTRNRRKKTPTVNMMAQEATNNMFNQFGFNKAENQENDENSMAM